MLLVIVASNYLVQFPINDWLTWGAFTFPVAFLVTDLTNRAVGTGAARRVAWAGRVRGGFVMVVATALRCCTLEIMCLPVANVTN